MQTICRLIQLSPKDADSLVAHHDKLSQVVGAAKRYSDVYRYWHAIEYLLAQHLPGSVAATWLSTGTQVSEATSAVPGARVLTSEQVHALDVDIGGFEPEQLITHYDAAAMDAAGIYPATWREWEEDFDPLGQVLEHYHFLRMFTSECAAEKTAMLLFFDLLAEGSV